MKKRIFNIITFIALVITAISLSACKGGKKDFTASDCVFTSFTAEDYDGNIVDQTLFSKYKVTMINVWGTFCNPCKTEAPELAEINAEYANKGFQIIGIPVDINRNSASDAREVIAEVNADYRHLKVSNSIKSFVANTEHLPYTVFINADGRQIGEAVSGAKSKAEWKSLIDQILEFANG